MRAVGGELYRAGGDGPRRLDVEQHVGAPVPHRLKRADGTTELHPVSRVAHGVVQAVLRSADLLARQGDRGEALDPRQHRGAVAGRL